MSDLEKITLNNIKYIREDLIVPCTQNERAFLDRIRKEWKYDNREKKLWILSPTVDDSYLYWQDFPGINLKELFNDAKTKID